MTSEPYASLLDAAIRWFTSHIPFFYTRYILFAPATHVDIIPPCYFYAAHSCTSCLFDTTNLNTFFVSTIL